ncbi:MAG: diaminopimelate epimerase [Vicinamibacteria bacterium]
MRFAKAQGLGNDFLLIERELAPGDAAAWARRLCDRHEGIGADGLILYGVEGGEVAMRLINADGGDAEISGNGLRCVAAYAFRQGWVPARHVVKTAAGPRAVEVAPALGSRFRVRANLGEPILGSREIPAALDPPRSPVVDYPLDVGGRIVAVTVTSLGNPHCALFFDVPVVDAVILSLGPEIERHPLFPRNTNVEFVTVVSPRELRVRFWERGVGYTRASGTGAASAAVAAVITGRASRTVRVLCDGGVLDVEWPEGGSVRQVGDAELLFEGEWLAG